MIQYSRKPPHNHRPTEQPTNQEAPDHLLPALPDGLRLHGLHDQHANAVSALLQQSLGVRRRSLQSLPGRSVQQHCNFNAEYGPHDPQSTLLDFVPTFVQSLL